MANQQQLSPNEQQALAQDVNREVHMLKDSADCLRQAHQWANEKADELNTRLHEGQKSGRKKGVFRRAPANSIIDMEEDAVNSFAAGINFYKIALIGIIGSFAGVIVEMLWCLLRHGYIESRAGLVYGPFNLVYGVGAVILTLALYRYRNRNDAISFFGGMILGSAIEYVLSWWQETFFGSTSWDYSQMPFNLNGRICLLYSIASVLFLMRRALFAKPSCLTCRCAELKVRNALSGTKSKVQDRAFVFSDENIVQGQAFGAARYLCTRAASPAPTSGARINSQTCASASPPTSSAGPRLRAGLTDVPVNGMPRM